MFTLSKVFQSFRRQTPSQKAESQLRAELAEVLERLAHINGLLEESCNRLYWDINAKQRSERYVTPAVAQLQYLSILPTFKVRWEVLRESIIKQKTAAYGNYRRSDALRLRLTLEGPDESRLAELTSSIEITLTALQQLGERYKYWVGQIEGQLALGEGLEYWGALVKAG
jgi:hypothetical protein